MSTGVSHPHSDQHAKPQIQNQTPNLVDLSLQDARQIIHALQVRQRELETQNAALQTAQILGFI